MALRKPILPAGVGAAVCYVGFLLSLGNAPLNQRKLAWALTADRHFQEAGFLGALNGETPGSGAN
jgi:hypothetical protein